MMKKRVFEPQPHVRKKTMGKNWDYMNSGFQVWIEYQVPTNWIQNIFESNVNSRCAEHQDFTLTKAK